jgi:hypothetical protein
MSLLYCAFALCTIVSALVGFIMGKDAYNPVLQATEETHHWKTVSDKWRNEVDRWKLNYNKVDKANTQVR